MYEIIKNIVSNECIVVQAPLSTITGTKSYSATIFTQHVMLATVI